MEVDVFQSTNKPGTAKVSQHFIVLQPGTSEMAVSEGILYQGDPQLTYNDAANGSFRFYLPPEAKGQVSVTINAAGGMPIQRPAQKTSQANVYKVDYPIKPGETRFDLHYTVPVTSPLIFSSKILHAEGASDLVIPTGVTVKGDNLELAGQEPKTQANIYRIKGDEYKVAVEGTGSLTPAAETSGGEDDNWRADDSGSEATYLRPSVLDPGDCVRDVSGGVGGVVSLQRAKERLAADEHG